MPCISSQAFVSSPAVLHSPNLVGIVNAILLQIPSSMMGDVTDVALLKFKAQQEGLMFSMMDFFQSIFNGTSVFLVQYYLGSSGYIDGGGSTQPENVRDPCSCIAPSYS